MQPVLRNSARAISLIGVCLGISCGDTNPPRVEFRDSDALGTWYTDDKASVDDTPKNPSDKPVVGDNPESNSPSSGGPTQPDPTTMMMTMMMTQADGQGGTGGQPVASDAGKRAPEAGSGGNTEGSGGAPAPPPNNTPHEVLSLSFVTSPKHPGGGDKGDCIGAPGDGCWGPENVGAVWVETADGKFVRTLEVWVGQRLEHLVNYVDARAGQRIEADAVSAASRTRDKFGAVSTMPHMSKWDGTDRTKSVVPVGPYQVVLEVADCNAGATDNKPGCMNALLRIPVDTAKKTSMVPAEHPYYDDIHIDLP